MGARLGKRVRVASDIVGSGYRQRCGLRAVVGDGP